MKIAILTLGTRGDVQPYASLGKALKARGHKVVLSTARNFENLVNSYDLDFEPVDADFQALLNSQEGENIRKNPFLAQKHLREFVHPMLRDALGKFYRLAKENDKVLFHIKTMADNFADQFPEKMIRADVVPAGEPTREFPNPVFSALPLPSFLNKFTFRLTAMGLKMWTKPVREFRRQAGLPEEFEKPELPSLYAISELLLKKPMDYPINSFFTGFWFDESSPGSLQASQGLNPDLLEFIYGGEPPLLITFGSMPFDRKVDLPALIQAVNRRLGCRIIVVKGWGLSEAAQLEENPDIKVIDSAPYDQLFPLVKAVIHHGGIGTLAACLRAGKPFWTCPVLYPLGDQHFWGSIAYKKGVAIAPVPLKKLKQEAFITNVGQLLSNDRVRINAEEFGRRLREEDGIGKAISAIGSL